MKTFVIHYDKLVNRKENILRQLYENNMEFEFIQSKPKDTLTYEDKKKFSIITDSEISLFLHHIICFQKLVEDTENDFCLVFEDDALFNSNFNSILQTYIPQLPEDWDMLYLGNGCNLHISDDIVNNSSTNIFTRYSSRCTDSYLISKKCAKILLDDFNDENFSTKYPIDYHFNEMIKKYQLKIFWAEPTIVYQGSQNGIFDGSIVRGHSL